MLWKPEFALGVEAIDQQHKELFNLLDGLYESVTSQNRKAILEESFRFLADYTLRHFADEEQLMKENGFPDLDTHEVAHELFRQQIQEYWKDFTKSDDTSGTLINLIGEISDWLVSHILNMDQQIALYLKNRS